MARVKKAQPDLNSVFFATPAQRVIRLLLSEPTTAFTPRVICSRLKGVRGLGGTEGLSEILLDLNSLGLVDFVNNQRAVRMRDDSSANQVLATFLAICDLENLKNILQPISSKGILYGNRAAGKGHSDSDYDLFVISDTPEEVRKAASRHPLGRDVELVVWTPEMYSNIHSQDPTLHQRLSSGMILWGSVW